MRKILLFIFFIIFKHSFSFAQPCPEQWLAQGKKEYTNKNYQTAKGDFEKGLNTCPTKVSETNKKELQRWIDLCNSELNASKITAANVKISSLTKEKEFLNSEITGLQEQIQNLESQNKNLQSEAEKAHNKLQKIAKEFPFLIQTVFFENSDEPNNYKLGFIQNKIRYIAPVLTIITTSDFYWTGKVKVKFFYPNGQLYKGETSPTDCSYEADVSFYSSETTIKLVGWGNKDGGTYGKGSYKVEVWYGDKILGSGTFGVD